MKTSSLSQSIRVACLCTAAAATAFAFASCKVKQTQEAKAPEVEVKDGQLPKYDVDAAKVTVQPEEKQITVPKVTTEEKTITVPDVDVTMPDSTASPAAPAASVAPTP